MKKTIRYLEINSKNFEERGWNIGQSKNYGILYVSSLFDPNFVHEYPQSLSLGGKTFPHVSHLSMKTPSLRNVYNRMETSRHCKKWERKNECGSKNKI
jgi:hypothetical protein